MACELHWLTVLKVLEWNEPFATWFRAARPTSPTTASTSIGDSARNKAALIFEGDRAMCAPYRCTTGVPYANALRWAWARATWCRVHAMVPD